MKQSKLLLLHQGSRIGVNKNELIQAITVSVYGWNMGI